MRSPRKRSLDRNGLGLCNCGGELRKKGIIKSNRCDGTKYVSGTTCKRHKKEVETIIRKQLKNAKAILTNEPVQLPQIRYTRAESEENNVENIDVNLYNSSQLQNCLTEIDYADDYDAGPVHYNDSDYLPSNQASGQPSTTQQSEHSSVHDSINCEDNDVEGHECMNNGSEEQEQVSGDREEEDMTPEQKKLLESIRDGTRAFVKDVDETNEEFCMYEGEKIGFDQVHRSLAEWRIKCASNLFPGSEKSVGNHISEFLLRKIAQAPPIGHVWQDLDGNSNSFAPGIYPTSKDVKDLIKQLGLGFKMKVTCEHHHPSQPGKNRGETCGYQEEEYLAPCSGILKIGIRYSSIEEYLRAKMLDPEFGMHIARANERWRSDGTTCTQGEQLESIFDGRFYKDTENKFPDFFHSQRHEKLHFAIFVDGFQPFEGVQYTLWAVVLICLNLPYEIRMKAENLHILTLIDGPKEPGNLQQYLKPIVDEFLMLWETGITVYDASRNRALRFKGMLACCIQDGRASKACSCQAEAGHYQGCRLCTLNGVQANGVHYYGHRIMLPEDHPYRTDTTYGPPTAFKCLNKSHEFIMSRMKIMEEYPDTAKDLQGMLGVQGVSEFSRLPYFDVSRCHILCFMHCMANLGMYLIKFCHFKRTSPCLI